MQIRDTLKGSRQVSGSHGAAHVLPPALIRETWIAGDENSYVPISASGSAELLSIDTAELDLSAAIVQVIVTGTGTAKLTVSGSVDGARDIHSLGDRITSMTAGSYVLKLNDSNLAFFPLLHFVATETGAANAVNIRARMIGRLRGGA